MSGGPVGRATLTYASAELGARGAWFALVLILGIVLPQRAFGAWSLLLALAGLVEIGLTIGLHGPAVRWLYDRDDGSYREVLFTLMLLWLLASVGLALMLDPVGQAGFHHIVDGLPWHPFGRLTVALAWFGAASAIPLAVLAAGRQTHRYAALRVATVLGPVAGVLLALAMGAGSAFGILAGQLLGAAPLALLALAVGFAATRPRIAFDQIRPMLAFGLPVLPHMMAQWVLSWSDRWLLERILDLDAVAIYHMAYLPALGVLLLGGALNRAWYPMLYRQLEALDTAVAGPGPTRFSSAERSAEAPKTVPGHAIWSALQDESYAFVATLAGLGGAVALWAGELLRVLPLDGYGDSPGLVAITVAGTTASLLYLLPHNLLYHHRRTDRIPWLTGAAAGLNLILNLALIPWLGLWGAAVATVLAYALLAALFWLTAYRVSRPLLPVDALLSAIAPGLACLAVATLLGLLDPSLGWRLLIELAASVGLVVALVRSGAVAEAGRVFSAGSRS